MIGPSDATQVSATPSLSRRAALVLLGGAVTGITTASLGPAAAQDAPTALHFRTIAIDTSRLAALGSPQTADVVQRLLASDLRQSFGDLMTPGDRAASTLVVRIRSLSLSDYVGSRSYGGRDGSKNVDYLEGAGVVTRGGHVESETPVLSALDASYSGPWYLPGIDERRVASITHHFAYWLRREMGV